MLFFLFNIDLGRQLFRSFLSKHMIMNGIIAIGIKKIGNLCLCILNFKCIYALQKKNKKINIFKDRKRKVIIGKRE